MKDEEERTAQRVLEAGGVEDRAGFLAGLALSGAPCKACDGAGAAPCHHDPETARPCTRCLGTGLAMDQGRLRLAAWAGDEAAALAASCTWCGGSKIVKNGPMSANACSSSTLVYPAKPPSPSSGCGNVTIARVWPEYVPCGWCARPERWSATLFAGAVNVRLRIHMGLGDDVVRLVAVATNLYALRAFGQDVLPDAWEALMDWTLCQCRPRLECIAGHYEDYRSALRLIADHGAEAPPGVDLIAEVMEVALGRRGSKLGSDEFDPFVRIATSGALEPLEAVRAACRSLVGLCMGATWG